jgi:hypothetical protein
MIYPQDCGRHRIAAVPTLWEGEMTSPKKHSEQTRRSPALSGCPFSGITDPPIREAARRNP